MNTLLLFFALPVATIILTVVLEKILRSPILTATTFFAIYLIVAFALFDATFLVFAIAYTILAFVSAFIAELFFRKCRWINNISNNDERNNPNHNTNNNSNNGNNGNSNNCNCQTETVTANLTNNTTGQRSSWCCYRRN